ncbi:MAG: hypothetical protein ABJJ00_17105 [Alphaproteobacteria bacterium]|mgnify:FL=1|tara:strand:+ start:2134 stop:2820 length:687 start_codon:yes stop_codon:yes gene_type:complete
MGLSRTTAFVAALLGAVASSSSAWASVCIASKGGEAPIPYSSPAENASFIFKITHNPDSKTPDVTHHRYRVKTIDGDKVRWFREPVQGKGPIQDVTLYRAFARVAGGGGWDFDFKMPEYDKLWPLKQGNEANYVVEGKKDGKSVFKLQSSLCVRGSKVLKLPAGDFTAHLVDISQKVIEGPKSMKWDLVEINAWYVPEFGTALLMEDRISFKGKLILIRRREAIEVPQ